MIVKHKSYAFSFPAFGGANIIAPAGTVITDIRIEVGVGEIYFSPNQPWRLLKPLNEDSRLIRSADLNCVLMNGLAARRIALRAYKRESVCTVEVIIAQEMTEAAKGK